MEQHTIRNYVIGFIILLAIGAGVYYVFLKQKPYESRPVEAFPKGTTVDLYKDTPSGFPKELVLEKDVFLDYSGTLNYPDGKKQTTVSYTSVKPLLDLVTMYSKDLATKGWTVNKNTISATVAVIQLTNKDSLVIITIAPVPGEKNKVTFQYQP